MLQQQKIGGAIRVGTTEGKSKASSMVGIPSYLWSEERVVEFFLSTLI